MPSNTVIACYLKDTRNRISDFLLDSHSQRNLINQSINVIESAVRTSVYNLHTQVRVKNSLEKIRLISFAS